MKAVVNLCKRVRLSRLSYPSLDEICKAIFPFFFLLLLRRGMMMERSLTFYLNACFYRIWNKKMLIRYLGIISVCRAPVQLTDLKVPYGGPPAAYVREFESKRVRIR